MIDFLYSIDVAVFRFFNATLSNPVFDLVMPFLTDLNTTWFGRGLAVMLWLLLVWKGGRKGRIVGIMLIFLVILSDQLNSGFIKKVIARPRPCHMIDGVAIVDHIRLLVDCGGGFSFPSSHAVNNIAVASYFSYYYRKWTWLFFTIGGIIAMSRLFVGVHYPSDILGGAVVGFICAAVVIGTWRILAGRFTYLSVPENQ
jgi:undecaprenyl-diphosphatase